MQRGEERIKLFKAEKQKVSSWCYLPQNSQGGLKWQRDSLLNDKEISELTPLLSKNCFYYRIEKPNIKGKDQKTEA